MKRSIFTLFVLLPLFAANSAAWSVFAAESLVAETRCGWFVNPTPANAWLIDAAGEWIVATQGGEQADGDWPEFKPSQWIKTNGNYGYGCACMSVTTRKSDERITRIHSGYAKALSACRNDKALKGKEPKE